MLRRSRDGANGEWLHLFTSTIRELYITDALDIIAGPVGHVIRFRYEQKYVEQTTTLTRWKRGELIGVPVATYFSLQHPSKYHPASFIPLRSGKVTATTIEGSTCILYFSLGEYLPLPEEVNSKGLGPQVEWFTTELKKLLPDSNPDAGISASLGAPPPDEVRTTGDVGLDFERLVRYMTPSLYFSPRIFYRVGDVVDQSANKESVALDDRGVLKMTAGHRYSLEIVHYQASPLMDQVELRVVAPEIVSLFDRTNIALRSRYDVIPVQLFAPFRDDDSAAELLIETVAPALGPTVRLPITVSRSRTEKASDSVLGLGGAMVVAAAPIVGTTQSASWATGVAVVGALITAMGIRWRRSRGLAG